MNKKQKINKLTCAFLFLLSINFGYSQKVIENPEHGMKALPGKITKIEVLEDATILHFIIKYKPKYWIYISDGTAIKDVSNDDKLFVTRAEGINLNERFFMPESGVTNYKLYFPAIKKNVEKIEFREESWYVNDIIIDESKFSSVLPNALKGDWLKTDGSNSWAHAFYYEYALLESKKWNYKSVEKQGDLFVINVEREGVERNVYAKPNKDKTVSFGKDKNALVSYSLHPIRRKSLNANANNKYKDAPIPTTVSNWIDSELAKVKTKPLTDFNSPQFFNDTSARLIGYFKGYDVSLGFKTGIIYMGNVITREDFPIVVKIHPDGRFEADLPINSPLYSSISVRGKSIPFYVEPGQTLVITMDLPELLELDRLKTFYNENKNIEYLGQLGSLNKELLGFSYSHFDYNAFQKQIRKLSPEEFKKKELTNLEKDLERFSIFKNGQIALQEGAFGKEVKSDVTTPISPKAEEIIHSAILLKSMTKLFDFVSNRKYAARRDTINNVLKTPVPDDYYDFLKKLPLNDQSFMISDEFRTFVNRFEYCEPFSVRTKIRHTFPDPEKNLLEFFAEEEVELTKEEIDLYSVRINNPAKATKAFYKENSEQFKAMGEKYSEAIKLYNEKYISVLKPTNPYVNSTEMWRLKDSILTNKLGLENNLVYELAKVRSLKFEFGRGDRASAKAFWEALKIGIEHPYLVQEGDRILDKILPENGNYSYPLPESEATNVFKKIIDPFLGKIVFVDFWATSCGPCVAGIERMKETRRKYEGNKDFEFVFITDDRSSPIGKYNDFVQKQELKNIYRMPVDNYNYLRQLFKFNGIPRYVVIDKKGNVINDNFPMHSFDYKLEGILKEHSL